MVEEDRAGRAVGDVMTWDDAACVHEGPCDEAAVAVDWVVSGEGDDRAQRRRVAALTLDWAIVTEMTAFPGCAEVDGPDAHKVRPSTGQDAWAPKR